METINSNPNRKHATIAAVLSLIPGVGQFYNRQIIKGVFFLGIAVLYLIGFADLFNMGFWGIITLGVEVPRDNSVFYLAEGILAIIVAGIGLLFYALNIHDAYATGKAIDNHQPINSIKASFSNLIHRDYPYLLVSPGVLLLLFTVVFPVLFTFALAFTNYDLFHSAPAHLANWVGLGTFKRIFTVPIWRSTFFDVLGWTVIWTLISSTLGIASGIGLAVLLHQKEIRFKKFWRTIMILPWAVPGFVTILVFTGLFNESFGGINNMLALIGIHNIPWMTNAAWTKVALLVMQTWFGFPYIFIVTTGVLQSIPEDLYEAAILDGASAFQKFRSITFPMLMLQMMPIIISQYTFNFNNFGIIYLFNSGGPASPTSTAGGTDILVSWIYKLTMQNGQYALAAALTILLSIFVILIALWQFRRSNAFKEG